MSAAHWQRHCPLTGSGLRGPAGSPGALVPRQCWAAPTRSVGNTWTPWAHSEPWALPPPPCRATQVWDRLGAAQGLSQGVPHGNWGRRPCTRDLGSQAQGCPPTHSTQLGCLGAHPEVTCQLGHSCNLLLVTGTPGVSCPEGHRLLSAPGNPALVKTQKRPDTLCSKHPRAGSALGAGRLRIHDTGTPAL